MIIRITILLSCLLTLAHAGSLRAPTTAINNTKANQAELADYVFSFIPDTTVPVGGELHILFPMQYLPGLGGLVQCDIACTVVYNLVIVYFNTSKILANVTQQVNLYSVLNPPESGGTGNFILHTERNGAIYDENRIFSVLGIGNYVSYLSTALVSPDPLAGTFMAGALSKYNFAFKTNLDLPKETMFQFKIPIESGFQISDQPSCSLFPINGVEILGSLVCQRNNGFIDITGLADKISAGSQIGIGVSLTNPPYSIITGMFSIAAFKFKTSVMYSQVTGISGVQITPGQINDVQLTPLVGVSALAKVTDYMLSFLPSNDLPNGAAIVITFPVTFQLVVGTLYDYVMVWSGLDDVSALNPLTLQYTINSITIGSFQGLNMPSKISIVFRATNPSQYGKSSPLVITTYTDGSLARVIDENSSDAWTQILNIASLRPSQVVASQPMSQGQSTDLQFTIVPGVFVPPGAMLEVLLPNGFQLGSASAANCISRQPTTKSSACTLSDNLIRMTNPSGVQYNVGSISRYGFIGFIQTPLYANTYLVDILIRDSSSSIILTYSDYLIIIPFQLTTPDTYLIGQEQSDAVLQKYSILNLGFVTATSIPMGAFINKPTDLQGRIEVQFGTGEWDSKLGTGLPYGSLIPCTPIVGLLQIFGQVITCTLQAWKVVIAGFQGVNSGVSVQVHIPNIMNPITTSLSTQLQIMLVQYQNRQRIVLNNAGLFTLQLVPQAEIVISQYSTALVVIGVELGGLFTLEFLPGLGFNINEDSYFLIKLPGYDTMFLPHQDTAVLCYIDGIITPCVTYLGLDWILLLTQPGQKYYYSLYPVIRIENLRWPRYVDAVGQLKWVLINGETGFPRVELQSMTIINTVGTLFPAPEPNDFISTVIRAAVKGQGYVGVEIQFNFIATNLIPAGGSVVLTFPAEFQLQSSFPQTWFETPQFIPNDPSTPITFIINSNVVTINGIAEHPAITPFSIIAHGVRLAEFPPIVLVPEAVGWQITTSYLGNPINSRSNFDKFTYGMIFSPGIVTFQWIMAFPSNSLLTAVYQFNFVLQSQLGIGGQIIVEFPIAYYPHLPSPPYDATCQLSGGLNSYYDCELIGQEYIITIDSAYSSGDITFQISNIPNPTECVSQGFLISTRYDSKYLDVTDTTSSESRTLSITPSVNSLLIQSIDFDPRNEGGVSTYTIKLIASSGLNLDMQLMVRFPRQYDALLGQKIGCSSTVMIVCHVSDRSVWISGFTEYLPSAIEPLLIMIYGVVNPNIFQNDASIGFIEVATMYKQTTNYVDYARFDTQLQLTPSPRWAELNRVLPSNTFSREETIYMFNFTSILGVPSVTQQGYIIVDFPLQFNIPNGVVPCFPYDGETGAAFASSLNCFVTDNSVWVEGNTAVATGPVLFNVTDILNPQDQVQSGNMIIKVYDGFSRSITEMSYTNLDPWTFVYGFPGPLIQVNGDLPIVIEAGTYTNDLWFTVEFPCTLQLNFTPVAEGFNVYPPFVQMQVGDLQQKFRVSTPESTLAGTYYIVWVTSGEITPPQYTPIKNSPVQVTKTGQIGIIIPDLWEIPLGGSTTLQLITVKSAPALGIEILFRPLSLTITMLQKTVAIASGQTNITFQVQCNETEYNRQKALQLDSVDIREIEIYLQGLNMNVYSLSQTSLKISFIPNLQNPFITYISVQNMSQTTATISFGTAEIGVVYYMVALAGTPLPPASELMNQGPAPVVTTYSRYFTLLVGNENMATDLIIGLCAQTPYVIYAIAWDRGDLYSDIKYLNFVTQSRFNASYTTLTFIQSYINQAEQQQILTNVAFILSLPISKVMQMPSSSRRIMQTTSTLQFYIISTPTTENYPSPLNLIDFLNIRKIELKALQPTLNQSINITGQEYVPYIPAFVETPTTVSSSYSSCTIQG